MPIKHIEWKKDLYMYVLLLMPCTVASGIAEKLSTETGRKIKVMWNDLPLHAKGWVLVTCGKASLCDVSLLKIFWSFMNCFDTESAGYQLYYGMWRSSVRNLNMFMLLAGMFLPCLGVSGFIHRNRSDTVKWCMADLCIYTQHQTLYVNI